MLLQDADAFGQGETLSGAVGTLSFTDSERESGYSISSLFVKYRTQLVGYYWAEVFGKEFPLQFSFNQMDDAASIRAELVDENGFHYSSDVQTISVDGAQTLDLTGADTPLWPLCPRQAPARWPMPSRSSPCSRDSWCWCPPPARG